ncbi:MAG: phage/plasmid primase, P4 family [bacterium]
MREEVGDTIEDLKSLDLRVHLTEKEGHTFNESMTLCPFHSDKTPSMSVNQKDGSWVWFCHSCEMGGNIVTYTAKKYGISNPDANKKLSEIYGLGNGNSLPKKLLEVYEYLDESGKPSGLNIARYIPKAFRPVKKVNGSWKIIKLREEGIEKILFNLPVLIKSRSIFLVEGEKDVNTLRHLGIPATTAPFGMKEWEPSFNKHFKGKEVFICYDHDAGDIPEDRAEELSIVTDKIKIIRLPGLKGKEDISDWLQKFENSKLQIQKLWQVVDNTDYYKSGKEGDDEGLSDLGNARRLVRKFGHEIRFCHQRKRWLFYSGYRWELDESGVIERRAKEVPRGIYTEATRLNDKDARKELARFAMRSESVQKIHAMISLAESEPRIPVLLDDLDVDPWLLNVQNGTVDLRTGQLCQHNPEDLITKLAPVEFDQEAKSPQWEKFLEEIFDENQSLIKFLKSAVGYSLTGDNREQCLFILCGRGANGKSTLLSILHLLLGDYARQTPSDTLLVKRYFGISNDIARLKRSRLVTALEVEEGSRLAESLVKGMTGGDKMIARYLYSEYDEFFAEFKIWIGTNHKPQIKGTDHAIWRRIRLIPFKRIFRDEEQDKSLSEKLKAELPGILNWAIEGCLRWQRDGLGIPEEVRKATEGYRAESDSLGQFLNDCTIKKVGSKTKSSTLYSRYKGWAESAGERPITSTAFGRALSERDFEKYRISDGYYYQGISLEEVVSE